MDIKLKGTKEVWGIQEIEFSEKFYDYCEKRNKSIGGLEARKKCISGSFLLDESFNLIKCEKGEFLYYHNVNFKWDILEDFSIDELYEEVEIVAE